jgi:hypothetical protein
MRKKKKKKNAAFASFICLSHASFISKALAKTGNGVAQRNSVSAAEMALAAAIAWLNNGG